MRNILLSRTAPVVYGRFVTSVAQYVSNGVRPAPRIRERHRYQPPAVEGHAHMHARPVGPPPLADLFPAGFQGKVVRARLFFKFVETIVPAAPVLIPWIRHEIRLDRDGLYP